MIKINGGPVQPPRVIGYKRTNANVDIHVRVEKRSFPLHTKVLAAGSGFFQVSYGFKLSRCATHHAPCSPPLATMCTRRAHFSFACSRFARQRLVSNGYDYNKPVELPIESAVAFETIVEFLYLGECSFPEPLLDKFVECAHFLQAELPLKGALAAFTERLTPSNCLEGLRVAYRLGAACVRTAAESLVRIHFEELRRDAGFASLPAELMRSLLADNALGVTREESAFEALTHWVAQQEKVPSSDTIVEMLRLVRYASMPRGYLVQTVLPHPLLEQHAAALGGGAHALLLPVFLDAFYGSSSSSLQPRLSVQPLQFTVGAPPPPPPSSPSRLRRRSGGNEGGSGGKQRRLRSILGRSSSANVAAASAQYPSMDTQEYL